MLTPAESFRVLVSLAAVGDAEALEVGLLANRNDFCENVATELRGHGNLVAQIMKGYDYLQSPEFLQSIEGKSDQFVAMKRKLESDPVRKAHHAKRFEVALYDLPTSSGAYHLLSVEGHAYLDELRRAVLGAGVQG